jgi:hypothetical protein
MKRSLALLLLFAAALPVSAQQRLFLSVAGDRLAEVDTDPARLGRVLRRFDLPADLGGSGLPVLGGRYLAWQRIGAATLAFLETRTGEVISTGTRVEGQMLGVTAEGDGIVFIKNHYDGLGSSTRLGRPRFSRSAGRGPDRATIPVPASAGR